MGVDGERRLRPVGRRDGFGHKHRFGRLADGQVGPDVGLSGSDASYVSPWPCPRSAALPTSPLAVTVAGPDLLYAEGAGPAAVDPGLTVREPEGGNLQSATVSIVSNYVAGEDVLAFVNAGGITGTWNPATGATDVSQVRPRPPSTRPAPPVGHLRQRRRRCAGHEHAGRAVRRVGRDGVQPGRAAWRLRCSAGGKTTPRP